MSRGICLIFVFSLVLFLCVARKVDELKEEAYELKEEAHKLKEEAYELKVGVLEAKLDLEKSLLETLALMRNQSTANSLYIEEIRSTLTTLSTRMDELEGKMDTGTETMVREMEQTRQAATTIKNRQKAWLSEIRLISLYKMTGADNEHPSSHYSDLIVDGQFVHDRHTDNSMRTFFYSASDAQDNNLWIQLGGIFKIHKIKILNLRHCCQERLIGAHVYADEQLLGTVVEAKGSYEFFPGEDGPTYASKVTLYQPRASYTHILELEVWGNGPFSADDKF